MFWCLLTGGVTGGLNALFDYSLVVSGYEGTFISQILKMM